MALDSRHQELVKQDFREHFAYDADTGVIRWIKPTGRRAHIGDIAGAFVQHGYRVVIYKGRRYKAHRVAWLLHYGEWPPPKAHLDHINGEKADNRICNLRLATPTQNYQNSKRSVANASGYKGVYWCNVKHKWLAQISPNKSRMHLGYFSDKVEAASAYDAAARKHFGEFARTNFGAA